MRPLRSENGNNVIEKIFEANKITPERPEVKRRNIINLLEILPTKQERINRMIPTK